MFWAFLAKLPSRVSQLIIDDEPLHYNDVIMSAMVSQITSLTTVYGSVYSGVDQRKHQRSASLAFVRGIHKWPMNSPHKRLVTQKMFPFGDVIMNDSHWCPGGLSDLLGGLRKLLGVLPVEIGWRVQRRHRASCYGCSERRDEVVVLRQRQRTMFHTGTWVKNTIQCGAVITRSIFYRILTKYTQ